MPSVRELTRQRDALLRNKAIRDKKGALKSEIRNLKYGAYANFAKGALTRVGSGFDRYAQNYDKRKKKSNSSYGIPFGGKVF